MSEPRVLMSWSGGKDSVLALATLRAAGATVAGLLTTVGAEDGLVAGHGVPAGLVEEQACAVGLPLWPMLLPPAADNATYRHALHGVLARAAADAGITDVAFGDVALEDVRAFREAQVTDAGLSARFPLWGTPPQVLVTQALAAGTDATVVRVDRTLLDGSLAGRAYDRALVADLPAGADPAGEGGELHTFVHRGPGFAWRVDAPVVGLEEDERFTTALLGVTGGSPRR